MLDMFPFLRLTGNTPEEQIASIVDYLIQFKETLEYAINDISTDNLSPELIKKLNDLGADIEKTKNESEEEIAQVSVNTLTISDVCESEQFKSAIVSETSKYVSFTINFDTGHLEYALLNKEV